MFAERANQSWGAPTPAKYCASVTGSSQSTARPSRLSAMAMGRGDQGGADRSHEPSCSSKPQL
jgi:hypothetical protein